MTAADRTSVLWSEAWSPVGWPDWLVECEGERIGAVDVRSTPPPTMIGLEDDALVQVLVKRVRHVPTGSELEERWDGALYRRAWLPAPDDPDDERRYRTAIRVIAARPPARPGPPKGSGDITPDAVFRTMAQHYHETGRRPTQQDVADRLGTDPRQVQRAVPGGRWEALVGFLDPSIAAGARRRGRRPDGDRM